MTLLGNITICCELKDQRGGQQVDGFSLDKLLIKLSMTLSGLSCMSCIPKSTAPSSEPHESLIVFYISKVPSPETTQVTVFFTGCENYCFEF
jgi:hypothetical protein